MPHQSKVKDNFEGNSISSPQECFEKSEGAPNRRTMVLNLFAEIKLVVYMLSWDRGQTRASSAKQFGIS